MPRVFSVSQRELNGPAIPPHGLVLVQSKRIDSTQQSNEGKFPMPVKRRRQSRTRCRTPDMFAPETDSIERDPVRSDVFERREVAIHFDRAEHMYQHWPRPMCIVSDGPYGVNGFPGDERGLSSLAEWYEPHVRAWSEFATPQTTLWLPQVAPDERRTDR